MVELILTELERKEKLARQNASSSLGNSFNR